MDSRTIASPCRCQKVYGKRKPTTKFGASGVRPMLTEPLMVRCLLMTWFSPKFMVDALVWLPGTFTYPVPESVFVSGSTAVVNDRLGEVLADSVMADPAQ